MGHKGCLGMVALRFEVFEPFLKGQTTLQGCPKVLFNDCQEAFVCYIFKMVPRKANIPISKYEMFGPTMVDEKQVSISQFCFSVIMGKEIVEMILMVKKQPLDNGKELVVYVIFGCFNNNVPPEFKGVPFFVALV